MMKNKLLALLFVTIPLCAHGATGDVSSYAGLNRSYGDGGPALTAAFNHPYAVAAAPDGSFYVADTYNRKIRKVDAFGGVSTLFEGFMVQQLFYHDGFLYMPYGRIPVDGGGYQGTAFPIQNVASDGTDMYRVVGSNLVKVTNTALGTGVTLAVLPSTGPFRSLGYHDGILYAIGDGANFRYTLASHVTETLPAAPWGDIPYRTAYACDGTYLYVAQSYPFPYAPEDPADNTHRIVKVRLSDGQLSPFAGSEQGDRDGTGTEAAFSFPQWLDIQGGKLYIADMFNHKIKTADLSTGEVETAAGGGMGLEGVDRLEASFNNPLNVVGDDRGNLYVAEVGAQRISKIAPSGMVSVLAGSNLAGDEDGSGTAAKFRYPCHVAVDGEFLYVADFGTHKIRRIHAGSGQVSTLAGKGKAGYADGSLSEAEFAFPWGIFARDGRVYVSDTGNNVIRVIDLALGTVTTLAGKAGEAGHQDGVGDAARFNGPRGLSVDGDYVYIADSDNHVVRRLSLATNEVETIAGIPMSPGYDEEGPAGSVRFRSPWGISWSQDSIFVSDTGNNRIRAIDRLTMHTRTLAGTGVWGDVDGPGASAQFGYPHGLFAKQVTGQLFVADAYNHKIRVVEIPAVTPPAPPPAPSDLQAEAVEGLKIVLSWSAPDDSAGVVEHRIFMTRTGEGFDFYHPTAVAAGTSDTWTAEGLEDGVTYRFIVRAVNADLEEHNTNEVSATAFDAITCPIASIKVPRNGKKVSGNSLTIMAEVEGDPEDILFQYRPLISQSTDFIDIVSRDANHPNPDDSEPYFTHWDPSAFANGEYLLRALAKCPGIGYPAEAAAVTIHIEHVDPDETEEVMVEDGKTKKEKTAKVNGYKTNSVDISHPDSNHEGEVEVPGASLDAEEDDLIVKAEIPDAGTGTSARRVSSNVLLQLDVSLESGQSSFSPPARINFVYDEDDVRLAGLSPKDLVVLWLDPGTGAWEPQPSTVDIENRCVSASVSHFSIFGLGALLPQASDLSGVTLYPSPFVPDDDDADNGSWNSGITFGNVTGTVKIRVYDVTGRQVWAYDSGSTGGTVGWDARNSDGRRLASGIYFAVIEGGGQTVTRKFGVVR